MQEHIEVNGVHYNFLKKRRLGGAVYASKDKKAYLRTGGRAEIQGEVNITRELYSRHFPVPNVLQVGIRENGEHYYSEESLGENVFGDLFEADTTAHGVVTDATFNLFLQTLERYVDAQYDPANFLPHNKDDISKMIALSNVERNNPPSKEIKASLEQAIHQATTRVMALPWGFIQSDLNAFNILERGVIDFEHAGFGPIGYDTLTCIPFAKMWPNIKIAYRVTDAQINSVQTMVNTKADTRNLPRPTDYVNDFLVLKAIAITAKEKESEEHPLCNSQFWRWRTRVRDWCISEYLKGNVIDINRFEEVGGVVTLEDDHVGH